MKRLLVLILLVIAPLAHAAFSCIPKTTLTPAAPGTQLRYAKADTGIWVNWWCPVPPTGTQDPAKTWWRQQAWAALTRYENTVANPVELLQQFSTSADPLSVMNATLAASSVVPTTGSLDEYNLKMLHWSACQALIAAPVDIPNADPISPGYCGTQPVPPPMNTQTWKALGGTIFTYASGKLTGITSKKAAAGAPATCDVSQAIVNSRVFCQLTGGPTNEVAEVTKQ